MNGQLGKWLLGFPISIYFRTVHDPRTLSHPHLTVSSFSALTHSLWADLREGKASAKILILLSRSVSALFGILCCLLVFMIGCMCGNVLLGAIAAVLLLTNPLFVTCATRAVTDVYYLFFLLYSCFIVTKFLKQRRQNSILSARLSILWGVCSALAASVKVTGILVGGFYFFVYALFGKLFLKSPKFFVSVAAFSCSAFIVIHLLNPAFWIPISSFKSTKMIQESKSLSQELMQRFKGEKKPIQVDQYPQLGSLFGFPRVFLEWSHVMKEQQENISKGIWKLNQQQYVMSVDDQVLTGGARRFLKINKMFFYLFSTFPFVQIFFLIAGVLSCVSDIAKKITKGEASIYAGPFLFFVANYIFILFTLKLNWDRYFLTTVVSAQIMAGVGLVGIGKSFLAKLIRTRSSSL